MQALQAEGTTFDLVYVDADKKSYPAYYELALEITAPGSVIAFDNVLWRGAVADPNDRSRQTTTLRELNARLHADDRVSMVMLPIGDGLTFLKVR
jgi:predicted O-methyltransferase YrrM